MIKASLINIYPNLFKVPYMSIDPNSNFLTKLFSTFKRVLGHNS